MRRALAVLSLIVVCTPSLYAWGEEGHRIVCRKPAGENNFGRPAYTHLLCYSRAVRDRGARAYPDVLPATGIMTWSQAMGVDACRLACDFVRSHTATRTVVDPFCGLGTVLAVANERGLDAIGVELVKKRARKAQNCPS